jgi:hypothetical protein
MDLPLIYGIEQRRRQPRVEDIPAQIEHEIRSSRLHERVQRGGHVAVAVGSRGIANISTLARATVDTLKALRYEPFIVAAMGSHGGATPEGQRQLLASYGITSESMDVPVKTDMDVVQIGTNSWGEPVYWDRNASQADAVITISRIKPHTDFHGRYESGIVKMLAIGLGKQRGAATHHQYGVPGLRDMIPESARVIIEKTPFALGLAVIENANEETALIKAVDRDELFEREPELLEQARRLMGRLPFDQLDLLVIGELGKNYSGTGLDVNVIGREMVEGVPDSLNPNIIRICVLDLSDESHGNAVGVGLADLTTKKLLSKMDEAITQMNYFTANFLLRSKIPIALANDRVCIETGIKTCWQPRREKLRLAIIPNTLELTQLWVTAPLAEEAKGDRELRVSRESRPIPFDRGNDVVQEELFPHSTRAKRRR